MQPENELNRPPENEIAQQLAFHNMERNMAEAYRNGLRPISAKEMRAKKLGALFGLAMALVAVATVLFMFMIGFGLI